MNQGELHYRETFFGFFLLWLLVKTNNFVRAWRSDFKGARSVYNLYDKYDGQLDFIQHVWNYLDQQVKHHKLQLNLLEAYSM